ncbi:MAG: 4-hydroxythreonine-4-phosphate dehydrogenase PdxA [Rhodospirillales bacterium]|nr:4-hydroxythreonine-4-phosphate dehydrogenase PdxA [Rhodospirillales bacterium]
MGEPAGIGGEIAFGAWLAARKTPGAFPVFFVIDDPTRLRALAARIGIDVPVAEIADPAEAAAAFTAALPVLPEPLPIPVAYGRPDPRHARAVLAAIGRAVGLVRAGTASAIVTNPIHKQALYETGFRHPGHTEYLAELAGGNALMPVMMLVGGGIRVVPVTIHMSLKDALAALTQESIVAKARIAARALIDDFGISRPRLALAALNPHAGEGGTLGREETDIIAPAARALAAEGIDAAGPLPADTLFHEGARARYDAVICMYHDQALIPLKTLDFARGINVTLGLPFVRTSPDHGTALAIAGTGQANPASLIAALRLADDLAQRRALTRERASA